MRRRHPALLALLATLICGLASPAQPRQANAAGTTWLIDRAGDGATDGDAAGHRGSIRFVLEWAQPGDIVRVGDIGPADAIFVTRTLAVGPAVSLGRTRDEPCGDAAHPLLNIEAMPGLSGPIMTLGDGATLRNITLSNASLTGPQVALKIVGADVDVCAAGLGQAYDHDGAPLEVAAPVVALGVDAPRSVVHRSHIKGGVVIGVAGDGSRVGDTIDGSGEANTPLAGAAVVILASDTDAARNVTVRDALPRGLSGMTGLGVAGGDDAPNHANHWALTPTITEAISADGFATATVSGVASPRSLVDIYVLAAGVLTRQAPVVADADGAFHFSGTIPGTGAAVLAGSTLDDPAHPARAGSSSALSLPAAVQPATPEPLLSAVGSVVNLSRPGSTDASPGERIRLQVKITNVGGQTVQQIAGAGLQLTAAVRTVAGSGTITGGGSGFTADDAGFAGGALAIGQSAIYTLDATVLSTQLGSVVFTIEVQGSGIIAIPVVGRMRLTSGVGSSPTPFPRLWLPLVTR